MGEKPHNSPPAHTGAAWDELRLRLAAARTAVSREMTAVEERGILKKRARALACPHRGDDAGEALECLEFLLSNETYAIEMRWVAETLPLRDITPVPCTPAFVAGIVNVRGRIVSVIDVRTFFDLPHRGLSDLNKVIIVQDAGMVFGILADAVLGLRTVPLVELQMSIPTLTGVREEYLRGVTRDRTTILDGRRLLADRNLVVQEEVGER
ncbi:MAG TPA: chemotaxis protein CheW [Desulfuromonadaceae bacterium]